MHNNSKNNMTKEYPGLPTQEEMKKEAEQFGDSQSASIVSTIAGRREAIMLGYFWGQDNLANRAISLLEEKDRESLEFAEWIAKNDYTFTRDYNLNILWGKQVPITGERALTTQELLTIYRQSKQTINK